MNLDPLLLYEKPTSENNPEGEVNKAMDRDGESWYDIAQVCLNGHLITSRAKSAPERRKRLCPKCGETTITKCPNCSSDIPGIYYFHGVPSTVEMTMPPGYCRKCGSPYPWTRQAIEAGESLMYSPRLKSPRPERKRTPLRSI